MNSSPNESCSLQYLLIFWVCAMLFSSKTWMLSEHLHLTFPTVDIIVSYLSDFTALQKSEVSEIYLLYSMTYSRTNTKKREKGVCTPAPKVLAHFITCHTFRQEKASIVLSPNKFSWGSPLQPTKLTTNIW